jgi:hypothetical protein
MAVLARDDVEGLQTHLFATGEPNFRQTLRVVSAGGDVFEASATEGRELSLLAVAAQLGAVDCAQFLLTHGAKAGTAELEAAFRGGNVDLMRLLWHAVPGASPLKLSLEAMKSWNTGGFRWLLEHKIGDLSSRDLVILFDGACSSGSCSCASSILGFSASAAAHLCGLRPIGVVGRLLCGGLASLNSGRQTSFIPEDSMAARYSEALREWLPEATEVRLVAMHEGRDAVSMNAFIDAAKGRAKTLTFVETENGGSI